MGMNIPSDLKPFILGEKEHHAVLHDILAKYEFGKFWVTDEASEKDLGHVRRWFDESRVVVGQDMVLHCLLCDGDHQLQFRLLLSIGVHPDLPTHLDYRPSPYSSDRYHTWT